MIESLRIENFKGIAECERDNLSRINLLIGKNNCGKSTILEAIYYTMREFAGRSELPKVLARRSNVYSGAQELWFQYNTEKKVVTRFCFGDIEFGLNLLFENSQIRSQSVILDRDIMLETAYEGNYYSQDFDATRVISLSVDYLQRQGASIPQNLKDFVSGSTLVEGASKDDLASIEGILGTLKNDGRAKEFGECLHDIFAIGKEWEFVPHRNRPKEFRVAFFETGVPLFLSGFGDGIRYAIQLITRMMFTKKSILLIEELESNQHIESLKKLVPLLVRLSVENNVQIFATTQNPQVWRLFELEFDDAKRREESFRAFHVIRDAGSGKVQIVQQTRENANDFWTNIDKDLSGGQ